MRNPETAMTAAEIDALLAQVVAGAVGAPTAIQLLVVKGEDRAHAEERVHRALGLSPTASTCTASSPPAMIEAAAE